MNTRKLISIIIYSLLLASLIFAGVSKIQSSAAMPMSMTDESQVPHAFGPNPNWALSPLTLPDAQVVITGNGAGAEAVATVGANGAVTAITITNPGHDYTNAKIDILGAGTGATADVTIVKKGAVVAVTVDTPGAGYTAPVVTFDSGTAAATAYGGVDAVTLTNGGGLGYTFPTVEFDLPDGPGGIQAQGHAEMDVSGTITAVVVDSPGSGYSTAPGVAIHNGTLFDPIKLNVDGFLAEATTSLALSEVVLNEFGANYNNPPLVTISDLNLTGTGATATAILDNGVIADIILKKAGSGYLTTGGIRKFVDTLPGLTAAGANNLGNYIPVAVPDTTTFPGTDYYEIAVIQQRHKFHSDLPAALTRIYVQLSTSVVPGAHIPLQTDLLGGTSMLTMMPDGSQAYGVDSPHYLGPVIVANKDRAVRITFYNLLPTGMDGSLFLPADTTIMGSGMSDMMEPYDPTPVLGGDVMDPVRNPMCTDDDNMMLNMCFSKSRATLHLHGGNTPWISDGTVHQWITPAGEATTYPEGVSVVSVPDMVGQAAIDAGIPDCSASDDGCMTFYYTNQQSARLMFYHDHSWGITRLNVYAGEAAGYIITDSIEQDLINRGLLPSAANTIPLVIQDKTFVPQDSLMYNQYDTDPLSPTYGQIISYGQDPTWDATRWGGYGNLWYHHVYMSAQNPGDPSGMSAYGRWMYGPWFWPPAGDAKYGPIANPYFGKDPDGVDNIRGNADDWLNAQPCNLDDPATWQYQTDPFCEPELIPGTPNISAGMEQFNDTPIVNGVAYPTITLQPQAYRFRILSAANDRFFNFQWYVADPNTASTALNNLGEVIGGTEVAYNQAELAAAQLDPVVFPTPDTAVSLPGPDWVHFGSEGGFLPAPVVVDGQQVTTWINDPTRFDVGNVDLHSLLLAPAERADVIVDFSKFAGQTLILYNDAPAAFPARIPSYDYYTGAPDLSPNGAPAILPGYGPNTRTIMQVKIAAAAPAPVYNTNALASAFLHKANGSGVFEAGQHPIIVGQAAYNSAYGTSFAGGGWCNTPGATIKCDGFARISQQGGDPFTFDTLRMNGNGTYPAGYGKVSIPIEPKAIHDETNASSFDEFGRMQANLGVEVVPATPGLQNVVLHPFVFPMTEIIDTTGLPATDVKVTPISSGTDGSQIWKITHNGVDTHPIHFHAYDVQVINRVTWDNIIIPPDLTELGWKDTVRIAPLEDTIVALRPIIPVLPWDLPNSIRLLSPMMQDGADIILSSVADPLGLGMTAFAPNGDPIDVINHFVNYGGEYVYHCHILSHEEMDMMRPVSLVYPPVAPGGLSFNTDLGVLTWTDNSLSETAFVVELSTDGTNWSTVGAPVTRPLNYIYVNATGEVLSFAVPVGWEVGNQLRVVAQNTVGDTWDYSDPNLNEILPGTYAFPVVTTEALSEVFTIVPPPLAPSALVATLEAGPKVSLAWTDNSLDEIGFVLERSDNGGAFVLIATLPAFPLTGPATYDDLAVTAGNTYTYRVAAFHGTGTSAFAVSNSVSVFAPNAPSGVLATLDLVTPAIDLTWADNSTDETGFVIERSDNGAAFAFLVNVGVDVAAYTDPAVAFGNTYTYRVAAFNAIGTSLFAISNTVNFGLPPAAPDELVADYQDGPVINLTWTDNSADETGFVIQRSTDGVSFAPLATVLADVINYSDTAVSGAFTYTYRVAAFNTNGSSGWSNLASASVPPDATAPAAPSNLAANTITQTSLNLTWADNSNNETGFTIQRAQNSTFTRNLVTVTTGPDVTSYSVSGLTKNTKYFFRVQAFNANFTSAWSPVLNVTTPK
ncbi:MAG: hypothetical protein A2Z71_06165 [Chloroflexi bacterium RBG_13_50_21]|nr:MAG: hypothetical protein A2Z71_06165 [Chloroflexi bacterium RBG_13_50_21]